MSTHLILELKIYGEHEGRLEAPIFAVETGLLKYLNYKNYVGIAYPGFDIFTVIIEMEDEYNFNWCSEQLDRLFEHHKISKIKGYTDTAVPKPENWFYGEAQEPVEFHFVCKDESLLNLCARHCKLTEKNAHFFEELNPMRVAQYFEHSSFPRFSIWMSGDE